MADHTVAEFQREQQGSPDHSRSERYARLHAPKDSEPLAALRLARISEGKGTRSERAERVSHASGAGHWGPASERVGEFEGR
jgi:hypothetical protein